MDCPHKILANLQKRCLYTCRGRGKTSADTPSGTGRRRGKIKNTRLASPPPPAYCSKIKLNTRQGLHRTGYHAPAGGGLDLGAAVAADANADGNETATPIRRLSIEHKHKDKDKTDHTNKHHKKKDKEKKQHNKAKDEEQ